MEKPKQPNLECYQFTPTYNTHGMYGENNTFDERTQDCQSHNKKQLSDFFVRLLFKMCFYQDLFDVINMQMVNICNSSQVLFHAV